MKKEIKIFDNPKNVKRLLWGFYLSLAVLLAADLFVQKHAEFPWAGRHQFFAAYGFVSCVLVITIAKILRFFVKRRDDYYDL